MIAQNRLRTIGLNQVIWSVKKYFSHRTPHCEMCNIFLSKVLYWERIEMGNTKNDAMFSLPTCAKSSELPSNKSTMEPRLYMIICP